MADDEVPTLWTVEDIASKFGVSIYTVRRWIKSGQLPAIWGVGRKGYRVAEEDVMAFWRRQQAAEVVDVAVKTVTGRR